MKFTVCLPGAPRTKKNHPNVFPMISMEGIVNLRQKLKEALLIGKGGHREAVRALMSEINFSIQPAKGYTEWAQLVYLYRSSIRTMLQDRGITLPIAGPVSIAATFYREKRIGDWSGYTQALGDVIQCDQWKCKNCGSKTYTISDCGKCKARMSFLEHHRSGLGLIFDDAQIVHWDGTRVAHDNVRPRVELTLETIKEVNPQGALSFDDMTDVEQASEYREDVPL